LGRLLLERPGLTLGDAERAAAQLTAAAHRSRRAEALAGLAAIGRAAGPSRLDERLRELD
jgi:hypothetical protein